MSRTSFRTCCISRAIWWSLLGGLAVVAVAVLAVLAVLAVVVKARVLANGRFVWSL